MNYAKWDHFGESDSDDDTDSGEESDPRYEKAEQRTPLAGSSSTLASASAHAAHVRGATRRCSSLVPTSRESAGVRALIDERMIVLRTTSICCSAAVELATLAPRMLGTRCFPTRRSTSGMEVGRAEARTAEDQCANMGAPERRAQGRGR